MHPLFIRYFPNQLIKIFAKPYVAGDNEDKVIKLARQIYLNNNFLSTLDVLGEDVKSYNDINKFVNIYFDIVRKIKKETIYSDTYKQPSISLKPSCFIISQKDNKGNLLVDKMDWEYCFDNILKVCNYAKQNNVRVTVEMEDRHWVDFTLATYQKLLAQGYDNVGTVLQTRLYRSQDDIKIFDNKSRVRLVIGIYNEPAEFALTDKNKMKDLMIDFSKILLEKGSFLEFASHDEKYIKKFISEVIIPMNIPTEKFEIQMLLGVPRFKLQQELVNGNLLETLDRDKVYKHNKKINFRLYLPFSQNWNDALAYCRRRLIENPNIVLYGLKNII
ncbi:MAG: proline dehydrogenase [Candidatus Sericytochromatia bacterium]|nr:MAG: proline dehydrogenase [Candidatus Sericytochromatia bacterium]